MLRFSSATIVLLVIVLTHCPIACSQESTDATETTKGIVTQKPDDGTRFVDLKDGRFMVPYDDVLPGTDISFTMVPIPGGEFEMGDAENEDTSPKFRVRVEPFWMSAYEATWGEYHRYMEFGHEGMKSIQAEGLRIVTAENKIDAVTCPSPLYKPDVTYEAGGEDNECTATITQFAAKQYTKWLSLSTGDYYRLPYESEWEYACRAGTSTKFYFGDDDDDLDQHAWFENNADGYRQPVGELEPNPWGLYDMYGNASEWVLDQYHEEGYTQARELKKGQVLSPEQAFNKPTKPSSRVIRGGSFLDTSEHCNSVARVASDSKEWRSADPNVPSSPWWFTNEPATGVGFRIIRPLKVPDRNVQEEFWKPDNRKTVVEMNDRIGKGSGAIGIVDTELHEDLESVNGED